MAPSAGRPPSIPQRNIFILSVKSFVICGVHGLAPRALPRWSIQCRRSGSARVRQDGQWPEAVATRSDRHRSGRNRVSRVGPLARKVR